MNTRVVNVKHEAYDAFIGRPSIWGNPFVIGKDGDRATVIRKYEAWIQTQPHLLARLGELRGKRLGCFCAPLPCHGHVLARLADALATETTNQPTADEGGTTVNTQQDSKTIAAGSRRPTSAEQEHVRIEVDRALRAGGRYNELHTAYWHAVEAAQAAGVEPQGDAAVRAARQKLNDAQPLLAQIRDGARATAQAAGWDWPRQRTPPWATATTAPVQEDTQAPTVAATTPSTNATRAKASRGKPLPARVAIAQDDPPAVQQAKARLNAQIAEAEKLGKSGAWAPLKHALSALQKLVNPAPRQILAH